MLVQEVFSSLSKAVARAERSLMYITGCRMEIATPYASIQTLVGQVGLHELYPELHLLAWELCNNR